MAAPILIGLTAILVFGIGAQWIAWRTQLPAILLLLLAGILAGPILGLLNPDQLMGDLFAPFISISVGIILFESGLNLRFSDFKESAPAISKLVSIGVITTGVITSVSAYYIFDFGWELAIMTGAILVVTGPTVILPLLRQVRPEKKVGDIVKWEGIVIDPVGAMLAVLVFEVLVTTGDVGELTGIALLSIVKTIGLGTLAGVVGAGLIYYLLKRHILPDFLQSPVILMIVVAVFTLLNILEHESGLFATTLMGIILANQKNARIHYIAEFKENLRVLLLSALFILLAARVELSQLMQNLNWNIVAFLVILIFIARPACVFLSTLGSDLKWREKIFLSWMAPRGVVAASVSSIFAIQLVENGYPSAAQIIPIILIVIIITVAVYGLSASWVARKLGLAKPTPNGLLILGAHEWALQIADFMANSNHRILVADSNYKNIAVAQDKDIETFQGNILSEYTLDDINLDGIGKLLCLTPNDEVNALASLRLGQVFGRSMVYQLPAADDENSQKEVSEHLSGRILFGNELTYEKIDQLFNQGAQIGAIDITADYRYQTFKEEAGGNKIPIFLITQNDKIQPFTVDSPPNPTEGDKLIYIDIENTALTVDIDSLKATSKA